EVTDSAGKSAKTSFRVTVLPGNTAPFVSAIGPVTAVVGGPAPVIAFTGGDLESGPGNLSVSAYSANPILVPNVAASFSLSGNGTNRTLTVTPATGQTGVAPITITISDGTNISSSTFPLMVTPSPLVVLYEPFDYLDGSLLTNSGFLWRNRSGIYGQCE